MAPPESRFPPPWTVHHNDDAYWVEDASGHRFGFCYFRDQVTIGTGPAYLLRDEARRIASNIAKLPQLLAAGGQNPGMKKGPGA